MKAGYQVVAINELLGLGFANLAGAFFSSVPTQIGLSRMGIAYSAGVKSQLGANILVAIIVAAVLQAFSSYLYFVPRCVLNAIIVNGASHLTEFEHMRWLWSLRNTRIRQRTYLVDFTVWWVACLSTICLGALNGICGAVGVSMLLIIYQVADPPITTLGWLEKRRRWMSIKAHGNTQSRTGVLCFRLEGPLFYANVERLQEWLADAEVTAADEGRPVRAMILSAAAIPFVDTTALEALKQLLDAYTKRHITFLFANACGQPQKILKHEFGSLLTASGEPLLPYDSLESSWTCEDCVQWLAEEEKKSVQLSKEDGSEDGSENGMNQSFFENMDSVTKQPAKDTMQHPLLRSSPWSSAPDFQALRNRKGSDDTIPLKSGANWVSQGARQRPRANSVSSSRRSQSLVGRRTRNSLA